MINFILDIILFVTILILFVFTDFKQDVIGKWIDGVRK